MTSKEVCCSVDVILIRFLSTSSVFCPVWIYHRIYILICMCVTIFVGCFHMRIIRFFLSFLQSS
jgi:hypothetical protein